MKFVNNLVYILFRDIIMLATFVLAVVYERASEGRLVVLIILFCLFFAFIHVREAFLKHFNKFLAASFLVDITVLALLDYSSKYVVDYYFNVYYFFVLIAAGVLLERKKRAVISFLVIAVAFIKYYRLIDVYNIPYIFSYIFFILMVFVTIAIFFNYSKILSEEKEKLNQLNFELQKANDLLEEKNQQIKELTIFEERNRIAREIHDSVGHNLTGLVMNLDYCEKLVDVDITKVQSQISTCKDIAKESLTEIRRSVQALKPKSLEQLPLIKSIEELACHSMQKFNIEACVKIEGEVYKTPPDFNIVVYRAVQEAITNASKHGCATQISITMTYGKEEFSLFMKDNGVGSKKLMMGNGLNGMVERVSEFKGEVRFYKNDGFMIHISVPVEEIVNE